MKRSKVKIYIAVALFVGTLAVSCKGERFSPKPYGYFRIDLLDKNYRQLDTTFPYKFEYPMYGELEFLERKGEEYWMNINFPHYNATIYLSYKHVNHNLPELMEDYHKMSYQHSIKADDIIDSLFVNLDANVYGVLTKVEGDAASPVQFYVTDTTRNFLRGSLYFYSLPNRDSLSPLITYFEQDIKHLMKTVEWKNSK